jgi:hypothetical protein
LYAAFYSQIIRLPQVQSLHGGFLTTVPTILAELKQPSMSPFPPAFTALLLTFVSEKRDARGRCAATEAMGCYGRALQLTRQLVEELDAERATEVIMAIFVLGMYEVGSSALDLEAKIVDFFFGCRTLHVKTIPSLHQIFILTAQWLLLGHSIARTLSTGQVGRYTARLWPELYVCVNAPNKQGE